MCYMHGLPSVFLTYTPDDINGVLNLRLTLSQTGNDSFPADGDGFAEAISDKKNFTESKYLHII